MAPSEAERPLQAQAHREIERSLVAKLKVNDVSDSFIERNLEDAIQRGWLDYLRALSEGAVIEKPAAFIVEVAFRRAIDLLRAEARRADGAGVEALLDTKHYAEPAAEEFAVERLAAAELREAIGALSAEERQVVSLRYFEERSYLESARILYLSERSYRRRLAKATRHLSRLLGAPLPEPGSHLGIEIGVIAWVGLRGARVPLSRGPLDPLVGAFDRLRDGVGAILSPRPRELATTLTASGTSEKVAAVASGPAGKVLGGCTAAAILCVVGFLIAPAHHEAARQQRSAVAQRPRHQAAPQPRHTKRRSHPVEERREAAPTVKPVPAPPVTAAAQAPSTPKHAAQHRQRAKKEKEAAEREATEKRAAEEEAQVEAQTAGIVRAGNEASAAPEPSPEPVAPAEVAPAPSGGGAESQSQHEAEAAAEHQFARPFH